MGASSRYDEIEVAISVNVDRFASLGGDAAVVDDVFAPLRAVAALGGVAVQARPFAAIAGDDLVDAVAVEVATARAWLPTSASSMTWRVQGFEAAPG